jgi:hypothetical protein
MYQRESIITSAKVVEYSTEPTHAKDAGLFPRVNRATVTSLLGVAASPVLSLVLVLLVLLLLGWGINCR